MPTEPVLADVVTLQAHALKRSEGIDDAPTIVSILSAIAMTTKIIANKVRRAQLDDVLGSAGAANVQGEEQQKLDVIANEAMCRGLSKLPGVAVLASEENDTATAVPGQSDAARRYGVLFDPLDGSSNIDVCGGIGTIFSIVRHDPAAKTPEASLLQPGVRQLAAGYVLYGPSTVMALTLGRGVDLFLLDPAIGEYLLVGENLRIPKANKSYSVNEGNRLTFPAGYQKYLDWAQSKTYSSRYAGAMVADVHRTLLKGGVFMYPPTNKAPNGKLRLMYEANPMAMLMEQAGGKAMATATQRIMEVTPTEIHQRTVVILGSEEEVDHVLRHLA
jgi:fructose-1,6-bisphosphatase I